MLRIGLLERSKHSNRRFLSVAEMTNVRGGKRNAETKKESQLKPTCCKYCCQRSPLGPSHQQIRLSQSPSSYHLLVQDDLFDQDSMNSLHHLLQQTIVQRLAQGKGSPVVTPSEEEANANLLNIFGFVQQVLQPWLISPFLKVKGFRFYIAPLFSCLPLNMS